MEIYIAKSGRESGPYTQEQIQPMLESGMLELTDSVWHKELTEWIPVHRFLGVRPPVPIAAPPSQPTPPSFPVVQKPKAASGDPATFPRRVCAYLIDSLILIPATMLCTMLFYAPFAGPLGNTSVGMILSTVLFIAGLVTPTWIYHAWTESSARQASLGKMACGLIVTDLEGRRLSFKQSSRRALGKGVWNLFGIVFVACLFSERRQCIHDMRAGCLVVMK